MAKRRGPNEGSIYQRQSDGRWAAALSLPNGKRKTYYGRTHSEVVRKLRQAQHAQAEGLPLAGERLTVEAFLIEWLRVASERVRPTTLRSYAAKVHRHLIPAIGRIRLARLQTRDVENMLTAQLRAGVPAQSVAHNRAVLRNALNTAMRWNLIGRNGAALAVAPTVKNTEPGYLSPEDARTLVGAVHGDRLEALFSVALALGLRQSEALGLRWSDIDLDDGTLSVRRTLQRVEGRYQFFDPKTRRSRRTLSLPPPLARPLREHRARQLAERMQAGAAWEGIKWGELVFSDEVGEPLSGFSVTRRLRTILKAAGLPEVRYHDLRHGAASLMVAQGVTPRVAMDVLGHSDIGTTMNTYAHVAPELQQEATQKVADYLWQASS